MSSNYDAYSQTLDALISVAIASLKIVGDDEVAAGVLLESVKDDLTGEKAQGLLAVAAVRMARAQHKGDPDTVKEAVRKVFGEN